MQEGEVQIPSRKKILYVSAVVLEKKKAEKRYSKLAEV